MFESGGITDDEDECSEDEKPRKDSNKKPKRTKQNTIKYESDDDNEEVCQVEGESNENLQEEETTKAEIVSVNSESSNANIGENTNYKIVF